MSRRRNVFIFLSTALAAHFLNCSEDGEALQGGPVSSQQERTVSIGSHPVTPEYYEKGVDTALTLQWHKATGDVQGVVYKVLLDTVKPPLATVGEQVSDTFIQVNGISPATCYYWRVLAHSSSGSIDSGRVWLFITDFGQSRNFLPSDASSSVGDKVTAMLMRDNSLWIGTAGGTVQNYSVTGDAAFESSFSAGSSPITYLGFDTENRLWVGTEDDGFSIYNPTDKKVQSHASAKSALGGGPVRDIDWDEDGNAWIVCGTRLTKIADLDGEDPFWHCESDALQHYCLLRSNAFSGHPSFSDFYVGTASGVCKSAEDQCEITRIVADTVTIEIEDTSGVSEDSSSAEDTTEQAPGDSTIITYDTLTIGSVPVWEPAGFHMDTVVFAEAGESGDVVWLGKRTRIAKFVGGVETASYEVGNGLPRYPISSVCVTPESSVWIGTLGGGLVYISNNGDAQRISSANSTLPSDVIHSVVEDNTGKVYLATDEGVFMFK